MGNNLRKIREAKGLSQQQCADAIGVSVRTWQRYESDNIGYLECLKRIVDFLDVTIDEIETDLTSVKKEQT